MKISALMAAPVVTCDADADLEVAVGAMLAHRIGSVVVVDKDGRAVGILTETDVAPRDPANPFNPTKRPVVAGHPVDRPSLQSLYEDIRRTPVRKVMHQPLVTLREDDHVEKAMDLLVRHNIHHLPVLRDGKPVGMVARLDIMRLMMVPPRTGPMVATSPVAA